MKASDLADRTDDELLAQLAELRAELLNLRFQHATGKLENPIRLRLVRRDIARVLTIVRSRELAVAGRVGE